MQNDDLKYFELLKQKIVETMKQSYPGINPDITSWKGQDITDFQEELLRQVNARISEKWFYNHLKNQSRALPRIDVLNFLSKYAGYANWDDFVYKNTLSKAHGIKTNSGNRYFIIIPATVVLILISFYLVFMIFRTREYSFSFYDATTKAVISNSRIEIELIQKDQSPLKFLSDSNGVCNIKTDQSEVKLVIDAPYYQSDTITRILKKFNRDYKIGLQSNDYELLISFFSQNKVVDWQKRRTTLDTIFDDHAVIYQIYKNKIEMGAEVFTKQEFIDKLSLPINSLKNMEILDSKYKNGKIVFLKFCQNEMHDE